MPASPTTQDKPAQANGHLHQDDKSRYEDRVGWAPRFGQGSITEAEAEESPLDHQTWVESKLDDKFFGGESSITELSDPTGSKLIGPQTGITILR